MLLPRALVARELLPDTLREAGLEVDVVPVYQTAAARDAEALRATLSDVDIVMLTSSSTIQNLDALLGEGAKPALADKLLASIGPITTRTAEKLGHRVAVTAEVSTAPGLLAALEAHLSGA